MADDTRYVVRPIEDRASLWPAVESLLPLRALAARRRAGAASTRSAGPATCEIGLLGWTRGSRDEVGSIPRLRNEHDGPLVVVLAEMPAAVGARALAARVEGTVLAGELERTLLPTLAAVAAGQSVVPCALRQLAERPALSPRERQILAMVVLDFSNAEIARKLYLSESNIKNHLSSAFAKLGVSSRNEAAELILDRESGLGPGILRIMPEESLPNDRPIISED